MLDLLKNSKIETILQENKENKTKKLNVGYNLFTLSSYNNQLENFHSDVIASFLQTNGLHGEGKLLLNEFLVHLNVVHDLNIDINDFNAPVIKRESGRLDILIYDEDTNKAIIFENKINDAPDMEQQLIRYYDWCVAHNLETVAILYVSLRGLKKAPPVKPEMETLLRNVAVFSNENSDLLNGWLLSCIDKSKNIETKSLLIQYCKLLKHLAFDSMEKITLDDFYRVANEPGFIEKINTLSELTSRLPVYRTEKFQNAIDNYSPFKNSFKYRDNYILYENYWEGENRFKLDVVFEPSGDAHLLFWNPQRSNKEGNEALYNKVKQINYLDKMKQTEDEGGFKKLFALTNETTMEKIDEEILYFVKHFMESLKNSTE